LHYGNVLVPRLNCCSLARTPGLLFPPQMHQLAVSLFRMIGALSRTQVIGSTIGCGTPLSSYSPFADGLVFDAKCFGVRWLPTRDLAAGQAAVRTTHPWSELSCCCLTTTCSVPCSSFVILLTFLAGGFVLSKGSTHPWTIWLYWSTPLSYAQNALSINEFAVRARTAVMSFTA
jgi:hypothetical protein